MAEYPNLEAIPSGCVCMQAWNSVLPRICPVHNYSQVKVIWPGTVTTTNSCGVTKSKPLTFQSVISECWDLCEDWTFRFSADQWWSVTGTCEHGRFSATSKHVLDVECALDSLLSKIKEAHPDG